MVNVGYAFRLLLAVVFFPHIAIGIVFVVKKRLLRRTVGGCRLPLEKDIRTDAAIFHDRLFHHIECGFVSVTGQVQDILCLIGFFLA